MYYGPLGGLNVTAEARFVATIANAGSIGFS